MDGYKNFSNAFKNLGRIIAEELGLYKLLDKLTKCLEKKRGGE